jgi:hypothetical protein
MHSQAIATIGDNMPPSDLEIAQSRLDEKERELRKGIASVTKEPLPEIVLDDLEAGKIAERLKSLRVIRKDAESAHESVKAPYLQCTQAIDAWKRNVLAVIAGHEAEASKPLNDFLARKEAAERARQQEMARIEREKAEALAAAAAKHQDAGIADAAGELLDAAVESEQYANRVEINAMNARPADLAKARTGFASASRKTAWVGRIDNLAALNLEKLRPYLKPEALQVALNAFVKNGGRECAGTIIREEISGLNIR